MQCSQRSAWHPVRYRNPVGWSLLGPSISPSHSSNSEVNFVCRTNGFLHKTIERMWESELQVGTSVFDTPNSKYDRIAYETMLSSISEVNGHYQLPLLWKAEGNCMLSEMKTLDLRFHNGFYLSLNILITSVNKNLTIIK